MFLQELIIAYGLIKFRVNAITFLCSSVYSNKTLLVLNEVKMVWCNDTGRSYYERGVQACLQVSVIVIFVHKY
jgi:hypothetical protein